MKRVSFSVLLAAVLCLMGTKAQAYDIAVENEGVTIYYNYINNATELEVTSGDYGYDGDVTIPEEVTYMNRTRKVTSIRYRAFEGCSGLTSVTIGSGVTSIGWGAFQDCSSLTSVTIPNNVTSLEAYTFNGCSSLTSVTIGSGVTSIGWGAFQDCSSLTSITIPNSVTTIGDYAFSGCSDLTSIVVEDGNTVYDSRNNCNAIIETSSNHLISGCNNTVIPEGVTSIGGGAFLGCSGLTSITIPNSVMSIGAGAFAKCSGLTSITIPNSVTSIGETAFRYCSSLTSVTIPNNVTSLEACTFEGCSSLTSVTIGSGVTSIGWGAFRGCSGLTSVTIPNNVTSIEWEVFYQCDIPEIISLIEVPFAIDEYTFSNNTYINATLYVPAGTIDAYKATEGWKNFEFIEEIDGEKCATPTISFVNGEVVFACETEGVEFVPTVTCTPQQQLNGNKLKLGSTFTVSVYATKEGCLDSDVATMTLDVSSVGDVNGDGEVNVSDVTALVSIILGQ